MPHVERAQNVPGGAVAPQSGTGAVFHLRWGYTVRVKADDRPPSADRTIRFAAGRLRFWLTE